MIEIDGDMSFTKSDSTVSEWNFIPFGTRKKSVSIGTSLYTIYLRLYKNLPVNFLRIDSKRDNNLYIFEKQRKNHTSNEQRLHIITYPSLFNSYTKVDIFYNIFKRPGVLRFVLDIIKVMWLGIPNPVLPKKKSWWLFDWTLNHFENSVIWNERKFQISCLHPIRFTIKFFIVRGN